MQNRLIFSVILFSLITSCVSDKEDGVYISDATLFNLAQNSSSYTYFKNSSDTLKSDPKSSHSAYVRIRFNPKAISAMNSSMDSLISSSFPDESMIVKELYDQKGGRQVVYAIMYKLRNAANNGSGWIWNEMDSVGKVITSAMLKGDRCVFCHSREVNSDLVRTFGLH